MRIKTLSATSLKSYEGCPKRWLAEQTRVRLDSAPGSFGTAVHAALDWTIKIAVEAGKIDHVLAKEVWETVHDKYLGLDAGYADEGWEQIEGYLHRLDAPPPMISAEVKEFFIVTTEDGTEVKVNYICDRIDGGVEPPSVRVIDYKTQFAMVTPESMRGMIQPNLYAVAMRRKYECDEVEVVYEMLRHHTAVSVVFSKEDMDRTERYLKNVAQQILDDESPVEKLNSDCVWCIRKSVCGTLAKAADLGWTATMPLEKLVERRAEAQAAMKATEYLVDEIDAVLMAHMREADVYSDDIGDYTVRLDVRKTGAYDPVVVYGVLGTGALKYMKVGKTALDKDLKKKSGPYSPEERAEIENGLTVTYGEPKVKVEKRGSVDL